MGNSGKSHKVQPERLYIEGGHVSLLGVAKPLLLAWLLAENTCPRRLNVKSRQDRTIPSQKGVAVTPGDTPALVARNEETGEVFPHCIAGNILVPLDVQLEEIRTHSNKSPHI